MTDLDIFSMNRVIKLNRNISNIPVDAEQLRGIRNEPVNFLKLLNKI